MNMEGIGIGRLTKCGQEALRTGDDKLREMRKLLKENGHSNDIITIFVGDSIIDLPCLLFADIGIVIGKGESLIETCKRVGVEIIWNARLNEVVKISSEKNQDPGRRLYKFQDWNEILKAGLFD